MFLCIYSQSTVTYLKFNIIHSIVVPLTIYYSLLHAAPTKSADNPISEFNIKNVCGKVIYPLCQQYCVLFGIIMLKNLFHWCFVVQTLISMKDFVPPLTFLYFMQLLQSLQKILLVSLTPTPLSMHGIISESVGMALT